MKSVIVVVLASIVSAAVLAALHSGALGAQSPDGRAVFLANCTTCHSPNGEGGGPYPPLAANADVNQVDSADLIRVVLDGRTGPVTVDGTQYAGDMPAWRAQLSDAQIAAVLSYIRSAWGNDAPSVSPNQVAAARTPEALSGSAIFTLKCAACHLATGGGTVDFPALAGDAIVTSASPGSMLEIIVSGRTGPVTIDGKMYDGIMPAWPGQLTDADLAALATYLRTSWGNKAAPVSEKDVVTAGASITLRIGESLFANNCAVCHGNAGQGGTGPALAGSPRVTSNDPSTMLATIMQGRGLMPSWRGQLSAGEVAAVATFIRSSWGNNAGPVGVQDVTAIR